MALVITVKEGEPVAIGDSVILVSRKSGYQQMRLVIDGPCEVSRQRSRFTPEQNERAERLLQSHYFEPLNKNR